MNKHVINYFDFLFKSFYVPASNCIGFVWHVIKHNDSKIHFLSKPQTWTKWWWAMLVRFKDDGFVLMMGQACTGSILPSPCLQGMWVAVAVVSNCFIHPRSQCFYPTIWQHLVRVSVLPTWRATIFTEGFYTFYDIQALYVVSKDAKLKEMMVSNVVSLRIKVLYLWWERHAQALYFHPIVSTDKVQGVWGWRWRLTRYFKLFRLHWRATFLSTIFIYF